MSTTNKIKVWMMDPQSIVIEGCDPESPEAEEIFESIDRLNKQRYEAFQEIRERLYQKNGWPDVVDR